MLRQKYPLRAPTGTYSNMDLLVFLRKVEYFAIKEKGRTKDLIQQWCIHTTHLEDISLNVNFIRGRNRYQT